MQATSALYDELIQQIGHVKEVRLLVAGEEYASDRIVSMESDCRLFEQDTVCAGSAVSHQLDVVLHGAGEIPRGAKLIPQYRLSYAGRVSEWVQKGVYYIDTREPDVATDTLAIHAYDDMLRMEAPWEPSQELNFPLPMDRAAAEIARYYGLTIDSRSRLRSDYYIDYPASGTSGRTIFKHIAAAHGGNWTMTDKGEARLVRLRDLDSESGLLVTEAGSPIAFGDVVLIVDDMEEPAYDGPSDNVYVGQRVAELSDPPAFEPISKVVIFIDDEQVYEAGDDSGRTLEVTCPYGTQAMADNLLAELKGYRYRPMEARDALLDPATELGDGVTVNGIYTVAAVITTTYDALMASDILAPGERELESETGSFVGPLMQYMARKNAETHSLIAKTADAIRAEVKNDLSGLSSSIDVQLEAIDEQVLGLDGRMGEVEITAETVLTRVNGLDDAYAEISTEVGTISATVKGIDGRMTTVEETAEGFTRDIEGLDGRFLKIEERVKGVTYTDDKGRVMINNGSLDLTGAITFSDFDSSTRDTINSKSKTFRAQPTGPYYVGDVWYKEDGTVWRCKKDETQAGKFNASDWEQVTSSGVSEEIVHTLIEKDLVESPKIRGGEVQSGSFSDLNGHNYIKMTETSNGAAAAALIEHYYDAYSASSPIMGMGYYRYGSSGHAWRLAAFGTEILRHNNFSNNTDTLPQGTWNFSGATVTGIPSNTDITALGTSSWSDGNYKLYLVIGRPSSSSSLVSVLIPSQQLGNRFQLADDSFYLTFTLNLGGVAINSNPSGGSIVGVYGIK